MNASEVEIKSVLRNARALIATPECWTQGTYWDVVNGVQSRCASGAIEAAAEQLDSYCTYRETITTKAAFHLRQAIERHTGQDCLSVVDWNDAPKRTHAEVLEAFDSAIDDQS